MKIDHTSVVKARCRHSGYLHDVTSKNMYLIIYPDRNVSVFQMTSSAFASHCLAISHFHINPRSTMALKANVIPYFALLSLMISVVPGLFWLYRKLNRPKKSGESDRQETRRSPTPRYHNERQLLPTYFYLEESRCRQAWILQQDVSANTSSHVS